MKNLWKISASLVWLGLVTGLGACANIAAIEDVRAGGKTFHDYLYAGYRDLALYEARAMYDITDSEYFALKARAAFGGGYVEPTLLNERSLAPFARADLDRARFDLMHALQGRMGTPEFWKDLARAQVSFDCWVEEQEEVRQPESIAACRRDFEETLKRLNRTPVNETTPPDPKVHCLRPVRP